jgi:tetratricopeptide (TPR) repeat protein
MRHGTIDLIQGKHDLAEEHFTEALIICRKVGDQRNEGVNLGNLGNLYRIQGELNRSAERLSQAIGIAREVGDRRSESAYLGNLGLVFQAEGELERALEHFHQAIDIAREIGNKAGEGIFLGNLGDVLCRQDLLNEAEKAFKQAIHISDRTATVAAGAFRGSLAQLLAHRDQFDEALSLLATGEAQVEPDSREHAKFLCKKGQVCHLAGDATGARTVLKQAQGIASELKVSSDGELGRAVAGLLALLKEGERKAKRT